MIGLPYDKSQTFRKGASKAPDMFRGIFSKLETYINSVDLTEHFIEDIGNLSKEELEKKEIRGFPIFIGGDHSVTEWAVDKLKPKNVVVFDAHPDCEDSDGHDGVVRRLAEKGYHVYIVLYGLRSMSLKEKIYLDSGKVRLIDALDISNLEGDTFVSIDFDVLDPSIMPAVGNPEPSGMRFSEVISNINALEKANIIGVDFVEYTPTEKDNDIYLTIAGKMIYLVLSNIVKGSKS